MKPGQFGTSVGGKSNWGQALHLTRLPSTSSLSGNFHKEFPDRLGSYVLKNQWGQTPLIYVVDSKGVLAPFDIKKIITPFLNNFARCEIDEVANYGLINWTGDGKELTVVIESPPHSSCENMGAYFGLKISIELENVIEKISANELRRALSRELGCRFK